MGGSHRRQRKTDRKKLWQPANTRRMHFPRCFCFLYAADVGKSVEGFWRRKCSHDKEGTSPSTPGGPGPIGKGFCLGVIFSFPLFIFVPSFGYGLQMVALSRNKIAIE